MPVSVSVSWCGAVRASALLEEHEVVVPVLRLAFREFAKKNAEFWD